MIDCRVLIVDDDAKARKALAAALLDGGFLVEQVGDGAQALGRPARERGCSSSAATRARG